MVGLLIDGKNIQPTNAYNWEQAVKSVMPLALTGKILKNTFMIERAYELKWPYPSM